MKYLMPVLMTMALVQPAEAQRFYGGSCAPIYHQPVYHQQVYHAPVVETVVREVVVPVFTPYAVFVDPRISYHYTGLNALPLSPLGAQPFAQQFGGQLGGFGSQQFGAQQQFAQQQFAQPTLPAQAPANGANGTNGANGLSAKSNESVDALIDAIEKRVRQRQKGVAFEPPGPPLVPGFAPQREIVPKVSLLSVLGTHCAECHTGAKSKGSFVIFDVPGRLAAGFDRGKAWAAVRDGLMPPRERPRLSEAAMQALK